MALGTYPTSLEINTELSTTLQSLLTSIQNANKVDVFVSQMDFAGYNHNLSILIIADPDAFVLDETAQTIESTITSASDWEVYAQPSWVTINDSTGSTGDTLSMDIDLLPGVVQPDRDGDVLLRLQSDHLRTETIAINQNHE